MQNRVDKIIQDAQEKILSETGRNVILKPIYRPSMGDMISVCLQVCEHWGITFHWLKEKGRRDDKPTMKKVLWLVLVSEFPSITYLDLAILSGHVDHAGIIKGIKIAKGWLSVKDEKFMKYYEPVKHMINEQSITA